MHRRNFLKSASATTVGLLFVKPETAFGYAANSAVRLGLIGCGNRGTAVATSFSQNTSAQVVALADMFPDNLAKGHTTFNDLNSKLGRAPIADTMLFQGPDAFERLIHSPDVDLVQISTPPFFHVQHLAAAVDAGKHVYCEKPVGVDVAQTTQALAIAKRVKPSQSVAVGFQVRNAPPIAEVMRRVQAGALGKLATVTANYDAPASTQKGNPSMPADEFRLRNWLWDRALSGDILVEQNIHIIDLCNLALGGHPLKARATGGRSILTHPGNCWDNYQVDYLYPNNVRVSFSSTQFGDAGFNAGLKLFGGDGSASAPYAGAVEITGKNAWSWKDSAGDASKQQTTSTFAANGAFADNLALADQKKDQEFIASITDNKPQNQLQAGVETALSCMLGRMAGLTGREVTWEDLLAHGETYQLGLDLRQFAKK